MKQDHEYRNRMGRCSAVLPGAVYSRTHISSPGCKTPVTAVSDKSKTFQEDEKTVYFSIRVTKKLSMALIGRHN